MMLPACIPKDAPNSPVMAFVGRPGTTVANRWFAVGRSYLVGQQQAKRLL